MRAVLISFAIAMAGACSHGTDADPPCGVAAARLFTLARDALAATSVDDATRRQVADQLPAMRDALAEVCARDHWAPAIRACLAHAPDHAAFQACEKDLTDAQRASLDRSAVDAPASP